MDTFCKGIIKLGKKISQSLEDQEEDGDHGQQEDHPGADGCRGFCSHHCSLHPCRAPISTTAHFKHTAARWKQRAGLSPQWRLLHVPADELLRKLWMPISSRGLLWIRLLKVVSTLSFRIIVQYIVMNKVSYQSMVLCIALFILML
ncbi:hypothetical protein DKX38_026475 [Salix brachista]|uniref:Uncharacterized protein n=1 Tax=Salix brachista TaxID=2182728 RepID=A0A5N5JLC4_9ROSI|nr:hypothetical protein DKX38_026475 [Salix brachista]